MKKKHMCMCVCVCVIDGNKFSMICTMGFQQTYPFDMKGISSGLINQTMPPRVINRSRSLDACVDPSSVAESCALESCVNAIILLAQLLISDCLLICTVDMPSDGRNKHSGTDLTGNVEIAVLESIKDTKEVLQKSIEISRSLIFVFRECIAVTETGANWVFNAQHGSRTSP